MINRKTVIFLIVVLVLFSTTIMAKNIQVSNFKEPNSVEGLNIVFLDKKQANAYLLATNYFEEQNKMSISIKTKGEVAFDDENITKKYEEYIANNLLNWSKSDKQYFIKRFKVILPYIKKYTPKIIGDTIYLIKSTNKMEFGSASTKSKAIIIPKGVIPPFILKGAVSKSIEHTLTHELFHIYSANNLAMRKKLYQLIGFDEIKKVYIPSEIANKTIIGSFYPSDTRYKITLSENGTKKDYLLLILSKYPKYEGYNGIISRMSIILGYMELTLVPVEFNKTTKQWEAQNSNFKKMKQFEDFDKKIKYNHGYLLNQEEIMAEDFVKLVQLKRHPNDLKELSEVEKTFFNDFENLLK